MIIKNIIFDVGSVIFDIDINRTKAAFQKLGVVDTENSFKNNFSLTQNFEAGQVSSADFRQILR